MPDGIMLKPIGKPNEAKKRKKKYITGMPIRAVEALIKSSKTPLHIKKAWKKKLKMMG